MASSMTAEGRAVAAPRARAQGSKLLMLTNGSRGDVQPYTALGLALQKAGFVVRIHTPRNLVDFARSLGLDAVGTNADSEAVLNENPKLRECMATGDMVAFTQGIADIARETFPGVFAAKVSDVEAWQPDAILASPLDYYDGIALANARAIPLIALPMQSSYPSKHQHSMFGEPAWCPHRLLGSLLQYLFYHSELNSKTPVMLEQLPEAETFLPASFQQHMYGLFHPITPVIMGQSPALQPVHADWSEDLRKQLRVTGWWVVSPQEQTRRFRAGDRMFGGGAGQALEAFLAAGGPPVYMGWGSMVAVSAEHMACLAVRALMRAGARGIVLGGFAGLKPEHLAGQPDSAAMEAYAAEHVLFVHTAPHEWLFPRCAATVHHGGAGTTAAALRSGAPTVVTPCAFDQFDHARLVNEHGVGRGMRHFSKVTAAELAAALQFCLQDVGVQQRARALGERLRAEDGLGSAVRTIDTFLAEDVASGAWRERFQEHARGMRALKARRPPSWLAWCARFCCSLSPNDYSVKLPAAGKGGLGSKP